MPLILGTNSIKDTGYDVANSLRFDDGSTDYLSKTFTGTQTNAKKCTISCWHKRSAIGNTGINGGEQTIISWNTGLGNRSFLRYAGSSDQLKFQIINNTSDVGLDIAPVLRDVSAWYHIVGVIDTTQGTASNRMKLYINGTQITSFDASSYPNQDETNIGFGEAEACEIGRDVKDSNTPLDGYLAEMVFIDGQALDPTSFGEFDEDTGIWKPIDVSGLTFGTNGFYLDFENSGSLGADVSGNGNNFTVNNLTSIDQSTDTCTNNFATLNPLIPIGGTFSEGNLQHTRSSAGYRSAVSSIGASSGKWYVEIKSPDSENIGVGVINGDTSSGLYMSGSEQFLGQHSYDAGYYFNGILYVGNSSQSGSWTSYTSNDIIGIAIDVDNGFVYFSKNGTFVNSGNPTSGSSGTGGYNLSGIGSNGTYFIGCSTGNNSEHYVNFGNPIFTISSGNSDGNGYGLFEYQPPSGYLALCTKNLATDG